MVCTFDISRFPRDASDLVSTSSFLKCALFSVSEKMERLESYVTCLVCEHLECVLCSIAERGTWTNKAALIVH